MSGIHPYDTADGLRYRVRYKRPDGRWSQKRGFKRKVDAKAWLDQTGADVRSGDWVDPRRGKATIAELGKVWLAGRTDVKPSWKRSLDIAWRKHVQPQWGHWKVESITFGDVQEWISGQAHSVTVTKRNHGILMQILDDAVRDRRIARNPAKGVRLPRRVPAQKRYLTAGELHRLARESTKPVLVLLLGYTGLRWGEAVALRVSDFDQDKRRLHVRRNAVLLDDGWSVGTPKTHKSRTVPMPPELADRVAGECTGKTRDALIFPGPDGGFMQRPRTSAESGSWWASACEDAEIEKLTPHDLRHTAASLAISSGAHVKAVQRMLGHASAALTLDTYSDLFDDDLDALAERMGEMFRAEDGPKVGQKRRRPKNGGHKNSGSPGI